jgi:hypothetical protein
MLKENAEGVLGAKRLEPKPNDHMQGVSCDNSGEYTKKKRIRIMRGTPL